MKIAVRRLAAGALTTSGALVAGLLLAPGAGAAPEGLRIDPTGVVNTQAAATLTFSSTDADQRYGALATFQRNDRPATFTVDIGGTTPPLAKDTSGTAVVDFTDLGDGVGFDGPADAGTYRVTIQGDPPPLPLPGAGGGGSDSCASCFTVLAPAAPLAVTSLSPSSLRAGQTADVAVAGSGFERGTVIEVLTADGSAVDSQITTDGAPLGTDATPDADNITTAKELRRRFTVMAGAAPGSRAVRVRNLDGRTATCQACFAVAGQPLTSVTPSSGTNDPDSPRMSITVTGSAITDGDLSLEFTGTPGFASRGDLRIPGTRTSASSTSMTATFDLSNAAPGPYQPVVRSAQTGIVNACECRFTVLQREERTPTVTGLDRFGVATGKDQPQGSTRRFDVTGTNFSRGLGLTVSGAGVTLEALEFVSDRLLRVTLVTAADAPLGDRDVSVRLTDGKTSPACAGCYTVTASRAGEAFSFSRLAGADRFATAATIATSAIDTATVVILANGQSDDPRTPAINEDRFPDALAAAYVAGHQQAPTLLTTVDTLPTATRDALRELGTETIVLIGGSAAISLAQEAGLEQDGFNVQRLAGVNNRYDTAQVVATAPPSTYVGETPGGERTAFVATGERFADALVAGPLSYASRFPVLLTTPTELSPQARDALLELDIERVLIPGGSAAVSAAAARQIEALGITVQRLSGTDRQQTAVQVANYAYDVLGFDTDRLSLARGDAFPDALAGGPHAGAAGGPIVLTVAVDTLGAPTSGLLTARKVALVEGHLYGGTAAISQRVEDEAESAAS